MDDLPRGARIARFLLAMVAVPLIVLAVAVRFTTPDWYWADIALIGLFALAIVLAIVGRVTHKTEEKNN
jgi:bacteriorhodopsin